MKLICWNVNSIRARLERLLAVLDRHAPDVVCLQELKVDGASFPIDALRERGYEAAVHGQKTYNGVAILSKTPLSEIETGLGDGGDESHARVVTAKAGTVRFTSVYVPNGGEMGSDKWAFKLEFYRRLAAWLERRRRADEDFALCGDFNVAPEARDVSNVAAWEPTVLFHPEARAALRPLFDAGLVDTFRLHDPDAGRYSWWDYRMLAFPKNDGLRIDLILASPSLAKRCTRAAIDRDERKGKLPSDHAPILAEFSNAGV